MTKIKYVKTKITRHFRLQGEGKHKRVVEDPETREEGVSFEKRGQLLSFPIHCRFPEMSFGASQLDYGDWNFDPGAPLCRQQIEKPSVVDREWADGPTIERTVIEFTDVLGCLEEETISAPVGDQQASAEMKQSKPQEMCNCAAQGESMFQVRSIVLGDSGVLTENASKRIVMATGAAATESGLVAELGSLAGHFAMAQAEFYFDDGKADKSEWLWAMNWKARMRRLTFGRKKWACPQATNTCETPTGKGVNQIAERLGDTPAIMKTISGGFDSLIVH